MAEQLSYINNSKVVMESTVKQDDITNAISKSFDYQWEGISTTTIEYPIFPKEFEIGLIVGSSGSGKSTILHTAFGNEKAVEWDNSKCIASHFESVEDASNKFGAVGLNSIPCWLKPYSVLSNGERFRADMARRLENYAVIDEFTSVVNREVALSCSMSISKYIRNNGLHNIVFCSCHDDIIPYLNPSWIYNTDTHQLTTEVRLQHKEMCIKFVPCDKTIWDMFKAHHYLSGDLNSACVCFVGVYNDIPIAFASFITLCGRDVKHAWREHRMVVLPDYQGMGIGNKMSEMFGQAFVEKGCRYFAKTSNPRMGEHRDRSPLWRATVNNHKSREDYIKADGNTRSNGYTMNDEKIRFHATRVCYSHEYIGDGTIYPYTYKKEDTSEAVEHQISLFD